MQSHVPPGSCVTQLTTNYNAANTTIGRSRDTFKCCSWRPGPQPYFVGSAKKQLNNPANFDIPLFSSQGFFQNMTVTFATNGNGNGFTAVQLFYSTNGGATFTAGPSVALHTRAATRNFGSSLSGLTTHHHWSCELQFTGGQSNGNDLQTIVDNIQINGTIVPEPATIAGGLLGVLGLCWFQRRRLIRSVRFRRT